MLQFVNRVQILDLNDEVIEGIEKVRSKMQ